jgi:hypothetical protein
VVVSIDRDMVWCRYAGVNDDDVLELKIWGGVCGAMSSRAVVGAYYLGIREI